MQVDKSHMLATAGSDAMSSGKLMRSYKQDCAILIGDRFEFILAKDFGGACKVVPKAIASVSRDSDPFLGFLIDFPYDDRQAQSEQAGHGIRYCGTFPSRTST